MYASNEGTRYGLANDNGSFYCDLQKEQTISFINIHISNLHKMIAID